MKLPLAASLFTLPLIASSLVSFKKSSSRAPFLLLLALFLSFIVHFKAHNPINSQGTPGGWSQIPSTSFPKIKVITTFASNHLTTVKGKEGHLINASKQIVAGVNYNFIFQVKEGTGTEDEECWKVRVYDRFGDMRAVECINVPC
jgi:hypothetical protein